MTKYTDDEIRAMPKITLQIAGSYLGISANAVGFGMRNNLLPIGFAVEDEERRRKYSNSWSYHIVPERLIAYKYGKINKLQLDNIEQSLNTIAEEFQKLNM